MKISHYLILTNTWKGKVSHEHGRQMGQDEARKRLRTRMHKVSEF
ncbi:hypothetical protein HanPI659440_Chr14g0545981 [Helianthus annuus]|nr:hypothetical protein HanPI659440_Chr14g0545981 [Helianthus annuus]